MGQACRSKVVQAQAQGLRFRQAPAEQAVHQAGENADHNAFPKELELKIVPVEQGLVRLADARIGLPVPLRVEKLRRRRPRTVSDRFESLGCMVTSLSQSGARSDGAGCNAVTFIIPCRRGSRQRRLRPVGFPQGKRPPGRGLFCPCEKVWSRWRSRRNGERRPRPQAQKTGPVLFGGPVLPEKGEELPGNDHARPRVF